MIPVSEIIDEVASALDAEGSDRYLFEQDYRPAINFSIRWLTTAMNAVLSEKKVSSESLRELLNTGVWVANQYSRVGISPTDIEGDFWTIVGIYPKPQLHPNNSVKPLADPNVSEIRPDKTFINSTYSAERRTSQEWNENAANPFSPGNNVMQSGSGLESYAYRDFSNYASISYAGGPEIEIRPSVAKQHVAIEYLRKPSDITDESDNIEFPSSMRTLLIDKTLNFISFKQGDSTNLYGVSDKDIKAIETLLM